MPRFSRAEYERLLYSLVDQYPGVIGSTLRLYTHSTKTAFLLSCATRHQTPSFASAGISFEASNLPALIAACIELSRDA